MRHVPPLGLGSMHISVNNWSCGHRRSLSQVLQRLAMASKASRAKTSANLQQLWDQIVSGDNDAMLTFVFPVADPFSPDAFSLVDDVRSSLRNQTLAARDPHAPIPGLTFTMFSPGSVVMDLIDVTSRRLPQTF